MVEQIIGFVALLAFIVSYQIKSNKALYLTQTAGVLLFALQFALLGAWVGCLSLILTAVRNLLLTKVKDWNWLNHKICPVIICILFTVILVITWNGATSLFSYAASIISTIAYWTNNAKTIRAANLLICSPCWIIYDVIVGSLGGILSESLTIVSIIVSIFRFGWNNLGQTENIKDETK